MAARVLEDHHNHGKKNLARVRKNALAEEDLKEIWLYSAADNIVAADALLDKLAAKAACLPTTPNSAAPARKSTRAYAASPLATTSCSTGPSPAASSLRACCTGARDIDGSLFQARCSGPLTMKCPVCEAELVHDTRNLPYTCDGEAITIPAVVGDYCPVCGDGVFDASESARVSAAMLVFRRAAIASRDAGTLDADEIMQPDQAWHRDALPDTERRYEAGHEHPVDWADAKQKLRERCK